MKNIELLQQVPLFKNLDNSDLEKLSMIATEQTFPAGSPIVTEGDPGDSLYLIKYGTVRLYKQGEKEEEEVGFMGSGQHFGEMALIDSEPRSATVEAVEHTELICLSRDTFENLLTQDIALGFRVYKRFARLLSHRLRETTDELCVIKERARRKISD
jgi:CRP-like cAMP-binding protein